jgi:hypothetical protein
MPDHLLPEGVLMGRPQWRGLLLSEERAIVDRWRRRRMIRHLAEPDFLALVRSAENAVIQKVMDGKLHIVTPED